jgi:hypothetical protein
MKSFLKTFLLFTGFLLSLFTYLPYIIDNAGLYSTLKFVNYVIFGSLLLLTLNLKVIIYVRVIFVYFVVLFLFSIETVINVSFNLNADFKDIVQIFIPFSAILIGYNINISGNKYLKLLIIYCFSTLFVSVYSVYYFIGSFTILDQYMIEHKNALGAILSNSGAIILCIVFLKDTAKYRRGLLILFGIIIFACLIVFRSRASFIALIFCLIVFIWLLLKNMRNGYLIFGIILISSVVFYLSFDLTVPAFLQHFFYGAKDVSDLNSVSSNRVERNAAAINFISEYPMFGQLTTSYYLEWVHNYVLLKVSQYGFLGSFPLLCLYFYLVLTILKNITRISEIGIEHFGYIVMIIPFFISLLEPSFPYGPGSVQAIVYFMFGYSLKASTVSNTNNLL